MKEDICFFEAISSHHALLIIKEKYGDDGIILFQTPIKSSDKILICAAKQISSISSAELKVLSETIKKLIKYGFSKNFIEKSYIALNKDIKLVTPSVHNYLELIFKNIISPNISTKGKSFAFIGGFGSGKTTVLIKFIKNCIENTIFPNVYYCYTNKDFKIYDLSATLKKMHLNIRVINIKDIKSIDNKGINFIDTQGMDYENNESMEIVKTFLSQSIIPIHIVRSDMNYKKLKNHILNLKKIGVEYFIINHFGNNKLLGNTVSVITELNGSILCINDSSALKKPISMNVQLDLTNIINS